MIVGATVGKQRCPNLTIKPRARAPARGTILLTLWRTYSIDGISINIDSLRDDTLIYLFRVDDKEAPVAS